MSVSYCCLYSQSLYALKLGRSCRYGLALTMENMRRLFHDRVKDSVYDMFSPLSGPAAASRRNIFPPGIKLLHNAQHSAVERIGFAVRQACFLTAQ